MVVSVIVVYEDTGSGRYSASSESCLTEATTVLVADFQAGIWDANWTMIIVVMMMMMKMEMSMIC